MRRFPDHITRRREAPGHYDDHGEYQHGVTTETVLHASLQPVKIEDVDSAAGARLSDRRKCYVPLPDALRAATEATPADRVVVDGDEFIVVESMSWRAHTKAVLLREG